MILFYKNQYLQKNKNQNSVPNSNNSKIRIVNLSSRILQPTEISVLEKGLSLVPYNNTTNKFEIATNVELVSKNDELKALPTIIKPFLKDNNFGKPNLTKVQTQAIKSLANDDKLVIQNSDKGNVVVILDKDDYTNKLERIIFSPSYEKLTADPTAEINKRIDKTIAKFRKTKHFPKHISFKIKTNYSRHPAIYGQVKVHKSDKPLRPIISNFSTILDKASKYIYNILKHYTNQSPINSTVKNTNQIITALNELNYNENYLLVSFDVVNLFGSINTQDCFRLVCGIINADTKFNSHFDIPKPFFLEILQICLDTSYFKYGEDFYKQLNGVPMGSSLSPILADIVMTNVEVQIFRLDLAALLEIWRRYVDDVLASWRGNLEELKLFHSQINLICPYIQFTIEYETNNSLPFLDILITKSSNKFEFSMYSKPSDSGIITNYSSFHPPLVKRNILKNEIRRFKNYCTDFEENKAILKDKFINNSYPMKTIENCITQITSEPTADNISKPVDFLNPLNLDNPPKLLILPYMGTVTKKINNSTKHCNIKIVSKKSRSLGDIFSKQYKYKTNVNSNLIYKITCSCGLFYIGETERLLTTRISEHERAVRLKYESYALYQHIKNNNNHYILWDNIEILDYEPHRDKRRIKEALFINKLKPALNLNQGVEIRDTWDDYVPTERKTK